MALEDHVRHLHLDFKNVSLTERTDSNDNISPYASQEPFPSFATAVGQVVILSIFSTPGLIGNILVIYLLARTAKADVMSRWIISRAIADILLLLTMMFDVSAYVCHSWIFGEVLCKVRNSLTVMAPLVISAFQVGMCINTYIEVQVLTPHFRMQSAVFKIFFLISWSLALVFGISIFLQSEILKEVMSDRIHCVSWLLMRESASSQTLRILEIFLVFVAPVIVSWIFVALAIPIRKSSSSYTCHQIESGSLKLEKRVKQLSVGVTVVFTLCQAPYWLPYLVLECVNDPNVIQSVMGVLPMTMSLPSLNAAVNAFLYALFVRDVCRCVKRVNDHSTREQPMIPLLPIY